MAATHEKKERIKMKLRMFAQRLYAEEKKIKMKARNKKLEEQRREFRCGICGRSFGCGQALGGHKNAHRGNQGDAEEAATRAPAVHNGHVWVYYSGLVDGYFPPAPGGGLGTSSSSSSGITAADSRAGVALPEDPSSWPEEEATDALDLSLRL